MNNKLTREQIASLARTMDVDPNTLIQLVEVDDLDLLNVLLSSKNTAPETLSRIIAVSREVSFEARQAHGADRLSRQEMLNIENEGVHVRLAAGRHPNADASVMATLARDGVARIRAEVARNTLLSSEDLVAMLDTELGRLLELREQIDQNAAAVESGETPRVSRVKLADVLNNHLNVIATGADLLAERGEESYFDLSNVAVSIADREAALVAAADPSTDPVMVVEMFYSGDAELQIAAASNPVVGRILVYTLGSSKVREVQEALAVNPGVNADALVSVARRSRTLWDGQVAAAGPMESDVFLPLKDRSSVARQLMLTREDLGSTVITFLSRDYDVVVRYAAASHPGIYVGALKALIAKERERLSEHGDTLGRTMDGVRVNRSAVIAAAEANLAARSEEVVAA